MKNKTLKRSMSFLVSVLMLLNMSFIVLGAEKTVTAKMSWSEDFASWNDVESEGNGTIFDISDLEPGEEEIRYIKIENAGNLAFSYKLDFVTANDESFADVIDVYYSADVSGEKTIADMASIGTLADCLNGNSVSTGKILPEGLTDDDFYTKETVIAIGLKMKEDASVDYMDKTIADFEIQLTATECDYEYPSVDKFAVVFPNTADYLYRVGNQNTVKLGSLFKTLDGADIGNVTVTIEPLDSAANVSGTFTPNATWQNSTIQFAGTGPVKVTIDDDDYANALSVDLEVIDAKNVTSYSELSNTNCVLLNDITMSSNGRFWLTEATLYGNGFVFDVSNGSYTGEAISENCLIGLRNGILDNVKIIGDVYTEYGAQAKDNYNNAVVLSSNSNNAIVNCYIANCAAPVRVNGGNIEIKNTTLKGGNIANIDIRNGHVTLDNVTTINQVNSNDTSEDGTVSVGLGIMVYYEQVLDTTTIDIVNGLTQYNYLSKAQAEQYITDSTAKSFINAMFDTGTQSVQYSDNDTVWVNSGILSVSDTVGDDNITDLEGYVDANPSMYIPTVGTKTGYLHTKIPDATSITTVAPEYKSVGQYVIAPNYSFDYTTKNYVAKTDGSNDYCYEDNGTVLISMDYGETFNWDTSILTVTKNGKILDYNVSMNGTDYTGKSIPFSNSGEYIVTYTYTDPNNYTINENGDIATYTKTYTKNLNISISVAKPNAKNAEFTFGLSKQATEKITIGNNTYISAKGVTQDNSPWNYITVKETKIYYPIVEATIKKSLWGEVQAYFPIFKGVVTITDYKDNGTGAEVIYDSSTTTNPSGLTVVKGKYGSISDGIWPTLNDSNLEQSGPENTFKYYASSTADSTPTTYSSALCYASPGGLKTTGRPESYTIAQYKYIDATNTPYYYYVGYHMANQETGSGSGCLTDGTLITLADGSQKKIEELTYEDELLAWNFIEGEYTTVPACLIINDGDKEYTVITLTFDDGTELRLVDVHGLFDADLNKFVYIGPENAESYLGHDFVKTNIDKNGNAVNSTVKLVDYKVTNEYSGCYTIQTAMYVNCIANNMLTQTPPLTEGYFDYFEMGDFMKYDEAKMQEDIEKYGLYTYEDFADYLTYDAFMAFNGPYLKVAVGKGYFTFDYLIEQIKAFGIGIEETITDNTQPTPETNDNDEIPEEEYPIMLLSDDEEIKSYTITSSSNTIKTANYTVESTVENNVITLTATGTASTGYAKITVDGEAFYTVQIPQSESINVTLKNTGNAKDLTVTVESFWGNSSQEGLLANGSEIDFGTFTLTVSGASAILSNTTKYPVTGDVYLAVYEGSRLISVKKQNITVDGKNNYTYSPEITVPENAVVKAFIWETDSMVPML